MKSEVKEILGFQVPIVGIVETLDEAITAAGSKEAVLKDYVSNVLAHSHYSVVRRSIVSTLETLTGVGRQKDAKGTVTEKDAEYIARLETDIGEEKLQSYTGKIAEAVGAIPVDYTPGTRGSGGGAGSAPAKKWLAYYDQLVAEEKLDSFCAKYGITRDGVEADALRTTVSLKIKEIVTAKEKAAAAAALDV